MKLALAAGVALGALLSGLCAAPARAAAQAADAVPPGEPAVPPDPSPDGAEASASEGPAEILVTATRRAERVQDVPLSITVVSAEQVQALQLTNVSELERVAPALRFNNAGQSNLNNFSVRGVGTYAFADTLEQTVGVNYDGVPVGRPAGSFSDLVDIDRAEILQGPQGLLFGKNASAGLVVIHSAAPRFEDSFSGRLLYGSLNQREIEGVANLELVPDRLALRVAVWNFERDGFIVRRPSGERVNDRNDQGARLRLRWAPTEDWDVNLIAEFTRRDAECCVYPSYMFQAGDVFDQAERAVGVTPGPDNYETSSQREVYDRFHNENFTFQIERELGGVTLTAITGLRNNESHTRYDGAGSNVPFLNPQNPYDGEYRQWTQELRLASASGAPFQYVAGLFYYDLDLSSQQTNGACLPAGSPACVTQLRTAFVDLSSSSYAAFAEFTYRFSDALRVRAGGRLSRDEISGTFRRITPPGAAPLGAPISVAAGTDYTNFSYRLSAEYHVDGDRMLYATWATGYKGPGLGFANDLTAASFAITQGIVDPERTRSAEIGLRSQYWGRRLTVNVTVYHAVFNDFQATVALPVVPVAYAAVNAAQLRTQGATLEVSLNPGGGFSFSGSAAYTDAEFTDYPNASCYRGQTVAQGCVAGVFDATGQQLPNAPRWTFNLFGRYETEIAGWRVFGEAQYLWKDNVFWQLADPSTFDDSYGLAHVRIGFGPADERWQVAGFVRNLFKSDSFGRTVVNAFGPGYARVASYETQRAFGVALNFNF